MATTLLAAVGLAVALGYHYQYGASPLSRRFAWEPVSEHARRAAPLIEQVNDLPAGVPISASSNLYPHVAHRERAYLFPTVSDAQFILLDATGPGSPAPTGDQRLLVRDLLDYGEFGVVAADHGFLLLERGLDEYRLSPAFEDVFIADGAVPRVPEVADFGGWLRLIGFDWQVRPVVRPETVVEITTYWQALVPLEEELRLVFYFWDEDGRMVQVQPEEQVVHWYPTWLWEPGRTVRVTLPPIPVGDLAHAGIAVLHARAADRELGGRVVPIVSADQQPLSLWDQDTILEMVKP